MRHPGDRTYHRALRVGNEYIVYTTKETTFGIKNIPTGHLTSNTNQPIYANRNKYEDVEVRVCESQYGSNHNHSMIINIFKTEKGRGEVVTIHHAGSGKIIHRKSYAQYITGTTDLYTQLIHNIIHTCL